MRWSVARAACLVVIAAAPAEAYIGPGAGFILSSSFLALFAAVGVGLISFLVWPLRQLWRRIRR